MSKGSRQLGIPASSALHTVYSNLPISLCCFSSTDMYYLVRPPSSVFCLLKHLNQPPDNLLLFQQDIPVPFHFPVLIFPWICPVQAMFTEPSFVRMRQSLGCVIVISLLDFLLTSVLTSALSPHSFPYVASDSHTSEVDYASLR